MSDVIWYVVEGDASMGPLSLEALKEKIGSSRDALVWREGFERWRRAEEIDELKAPGPPPVPSQPTQDAGITGWLFFPMLITALAPVIIAFDMIDVWLTNDRNAMVVGTVIGAALMTVAILAIVSMWQHKRSYPKLFIVLLVANVVLGTAGLAIDPEPTVAPLRSWVALFIWGPYMLVSKRVRNTFVN